MHSQSMQMSAQLNCTNSGKRVPTWVFNRSQESVSPGTCPRVTVAIPDHDSWREKILPDTCLGFWSECSSSHHEGYHQHGADSGRNCEPRCIHVHRRPVYQWGCCARNPHQRTSGSVWAGMQRPETVEGQCTSAGTGGRNRTRWMAMEARKWGSWHPRCHHTMDSILFVWEACWAPSGVWLAPCGLCRTQEVSKFDHEGLGQQNKRRLPPVHGVWDRGLCTTGRSGLWGFMCWRSGAECVGLYQFSGAQSDSGETLNSAGEYLLAATREQHPTYQPRRAGCHIERHQFSSPVTEQGATCEDRFCVHLLLGIRHSDLKSMSA